MTLGMALYSSSICALVIRRGRVSADTPAVSQTLLATAELTRLKGELTDAEERTRSAEKERDEALALVNSLMRRLGTPGLDED